MAHLKCVTCRTRYYTPGDPLEEICPSCGCAFVAVGELSEIVGYRAITAHDRTAAGTSSPGFVDRLGDLLERRARDSPGRSSSS
jgi:hypothetical protein